jgi:hypothetical protein
VATEVEREAAAKAAAAMGAETAAEVKEAAATAEGKVAVERAVAATVVEMEVGAKEAAAQAAAKEVVMAVAEMAVVRVVRRRLHPHSSERREAGRLARNGAHDRRRDRHARSSDARLRTSARTAPMSKHTRHRSHSRCSWSRPARATNRGVRRRRGNEPPPPER